MCQWHVTAGAAAGGAGLNYIIFTFILKIPDKSEVCQTINEGELTWHTKLFSVWGHFLECLICWWDIGSFEHLLKWNLVRTLDYLLELLPTQRQLKLSDKCSGADCTIFNKKCREVEE